MKYKAFAVTISRRFVICQYMRILVYDKFQIVVPTTLH